MAKIPNQRANVKNPNNPDHQAAADNRSRQLNADQAQQQSAAQEQQQSTAQGQQEARPGKQTGETG